MSSTPDWPEDLLVRARRGQLSAADQQRLKQFLQGSSALRVAHQVGLDFDRSGAVQPGDEQRIRSFVAHAAGRHHERRRPARLPRRLAPWLLAAAVLISGTAAFGLWRGWAGSGSPAPKAAGLTEAAKTPQPSKPAQKLGQSEQAAGSSPEAEPSAEGADSDPGLPSPPLRSPAPTGAKASPAAPREPRIEPGRTAARPPPVPDSSPTPPAAAFEPPQAAAKPTAARLFSTANAARRAGQAAEAIGLFLRLQQQFPASAEAQLAHVSLGRLHLARGEAQQALAQFTRYLQGGGPLTQEALLGQARALAALGRHDEERTTWEALRQRFPNSVYAARARERLEQLNQNAAK